MTTSFEPTSELRDFIGLVRARKVSVVAITLIVTAAALFAAMRRPSVYVAHAEVLVRPTAQTVGSGLSLPQAPNMETERLLVLSQDVARGVHAHAAPRLSTQTLLQNVHVQVAGDTEVLDVSYSSTSAATAVANGFAAAYVDYRTKRTLDQYAAAASAVQQRITSARNALDALSHGNGSPGTEETASERDALVAQLTVLSQRLLDLQTTSESVQSAGEVIQSATIPTSPSSPNPLRDSTLGFGAGLMLALGVVLLRERLDDRVKSIEDLEKEFDTPVLTAVPRLRDWRRREDAYLAVLADPRSPVSEAYRTLATSVQYNGSRRSAKTIMVTSSMGEDGKSTTVANLSIALAQGGKRVIAISADLRRPRLHDFFGFPNDVGLSEVLLQQANIITALKPARGVQNLRVIVSGRPPENPAALLGSKQFEDLLDELRQVSDFVIVDTPPVLAVGDASILAPLVDATIFIVGGQQSRRSSVRRSWSQLRTAGARVMGVVYNSFDPSGRGGYYNYEYAYSTGHPMAQQKLRDDGSTRRMRRASARRSKAIGLEPPAPRHPNHASQSI